MFLELYMTVLYLNMWDIEVAKNKKLEENFQT